MYLAKQKKVQKKCAGKRPRMTDELQMTMMAAEIGATIAAERSKRDIK